MAAQYNFLKPIDQKVRDQGYDFVSKDEFLQDGFKPTSDISYEGDGSPVSYANSMGGIMSQAPIPGPLKYIPEGDGDGGGDGPPGPGPDNSGFDYESEAYGIDGMTAEEKGITEEEQAGLNSIKNAKMSKMDALKAAGAFAFMGPFAGIFSAYRSQKKAKQDAIDKEKAAQQQRDRDAEVKSIQGRLDSGMSLGDIGRESYTGPGMAFEERDTGTGRGPKKDGGRAGYFFGGRVNYKTGGRTGYKDGYSVQDDIGDYAANVGKEAAPGGGFVGDGGNGDSGTKPVFYDKNDNIITTDFISKNPNLTINYTDPRNYASLKSKIGFNNILDNDDITAEGNVTGKIGPVSYDTFFTDQGITGTNLKAGNFNTNINPDMEIQNIGYNNNINGINYGVNTDFDNTMFTAGVNFKNGGLASIL